MISVCPNTLNARLGHLAQHMQVYHQMLKNLKKHPIPRAMRTFFKVPMISFQSLHCSILPTHSCMMRMYILVYGSNLCFILATIATPTQESATQNRKVMSLNKYSLRKFLILPS